MLDIVPILIVFLIVVLVLVSVGFFGVSGQIETEPTKMTKRLELNSDQDKVLSIPPPYVPCNPSIIKTKTGYRICLRTVNYRIGKSYQCPDGKEINTINYLINIDKNFKLLDSVELKDKSGLKLYKGKIHGIEDVRLFGENKFFCSYPEANETKIYKIYYGEYDKDGTVRSLTPINFTNVNEKNWLPFIDNGKVYFIYGWSPLTVYRLDGTTPVEIYRLSDKNPIKIYRPKDKTTAAFVKTNKLTTPLHRSELRGSSPPIPYKKGWLCSVHFVLKRPTRYYHRFVWFSREFDKIKIGKPFYFEKVGIEFNLSICDSGNDILVGYSVNDCSGIIASVDYKTIEDSLENNEY